MATADFNDGRIFVFGSNLAGRHGLGAARFAHMFRGAIYGRGVGLQGQSYAIPTKSITIRDSLSLEKIKKYVSDFLIFVLAHPDVRFEVTKIGCGLAGYSERDIAPMFRDASSNCDLPEGWRELSLS